MDAPCKAGGQGGWGSVTRLSQLWSGLLWFWSVVKTEHVRIMKE